MEKGITADHFQVWKDQVRQWRLNCLAFLRTAVSHQDAVAFKTVLFTKLDFVYKINDEHNQILNETNAHIDQLRIINDRFRPYWITMMPEWRTIIEVHLANFKGE